MRKRLKKLIAKASLLSFLSLSPVSKATTVGSHNITPILCSKSGEHTCICKYFEKPGDRSDAAVNYATRGCFGLVLGCCSLALACRKGKKDDPRTDPAERLFCACVGCIGVALSFFSFRGFANVVRGVPLAHLTNGFGYLSLSGKDNGR